MTPPSQPRFYPFRFLLIALVIAMAMEGLANGVGAWLSILTLCAVVCAICALIERYCTRG